MHKEIHKGRVHSLESFGSADGPGVRFIVFLDGCNMRCKYCHNPDSWARPDMATEMSPQEILSKALRCREYWGKNGGITISGGEPLLQLDFLLDLFELCKAHNVNTCIDTSGEPFSRQNHQFEKIKRLANLTDLFLLDIKHIDSPSHKNLTGCDNSNILDFANFLSEINKPTWIRYVLVPTINSDENTLLKTVDFIKNLSNVKKIEILPYHTLGIFKYKALGIPYQLQNVPTPTEEELSIANKILQSAIIK